MELRRSTWMFVGGLTLGAVVLMLGTLNARRLEQEQFKARALCEAKPAVSEQTPLTKGVDPEIAALFAESDQVNAVKTCYANQHAPTDDAIAVTARRGWFVAAIVAILGALPWAWYFLLRRIAELRAAIGGNPPKG